MAVKCAAPKCRSGYKPKKSDYKQAEKGETPDHKKHVFRFPKDKQLRKQLWIQAIRRNDFNADHTGICEKHFQPSDLLPNVSPRTNVERQRFRLRPNAVPTISDNSPDADACPTDLTRPTKSARGSPEMQLLQSQLDEFQEQDSVLDVPGLHNKLLNERLPSGFRLVLMEHHGKPLLSIRTEEIDSETGLPTFTHNVSIFEDLSFKMHHQGILLSNNTMADIAKSGKLSTVGQVLSVLARLKTLFADTASRLQASAQLLEDICTDPNSEEHVQPLVTFAVEQLRLVTKQSNARRYSSALLGNAVVWDRSSPKLYDQLQQSELFCLPHSKTLRRLTSALWMGAGPEEATMDTAAEVTKTLFCTWYFLLSMAQPTLSINSPNVSMFSLIPSCYVSRMF